jgi:hypothetical protein
MHVLNVSLRLCFVWPLRTGAIVYGPFYTECQHMLRIAFNDPVRVYR